MQTYIKDQKDGQKIDAEDKRKIINYAVVCVNEFADKFDITSRDAFMYLYKYKGIDFLKEHYDVEHTLSLNDAVEDLTRICRNNGGSY